MSAGTSIQWTDATWNPVRGCTRVSEGCRRCYAERMAARMSRPGMWGHGFAEPTTYGPRWTGRVELVADQLDLPLTWRTARRVFVNSTSDLFHEALPFTDIAQVLERMAWGFRLACRRADDGDQWDPTCRCFACRCFVDVPQHTYQILTKRPARMLEFFRWLETDEGDAAAPTVAFSRVEADWPLPNVWLGVSVEDQVTAEARIPLLLQAPAAVRWVSYEPALGPVDLKPFLPRPLYHCAGCGRELRGRWCGRCSATTGDVPTNLLQGLDWLVVGGESGPGARPFDVAWARATVAQCRAAGVPVFVKQLGSRPVAFDPDHEWFDGQDFHRGGRARMKLRMKLRDAKGGDPSEWPYDLRVRQLPGGAA